MLIRNTDRVYLRAATVKSARAMVTPLDQESSDKCSGAGSMGDPAVGLQKKYRTAYHAVPLLTAVIYYVRRVQGIVAVPPKRAPDPAVDPFPVSFNTILQYQIRLQHILNMQRNKPFG